MRSQVGARNLTRISDVQFQSSELRTELIPRPGARGSVPVPVLASVFNPLTRDIQAPSLLGVLSSLWRSI